MKNGGGSESTITIGPSRSVLFYALHSLEYVLGLTRFRVLVPNLYMFMQLKKESIRCFDGKDILHIDVWIEDFEETASVLGWNEFQTYIFAKRSLKGLAT